ncbi:CAAX prenyl protease 1 [Lecanosticta acicola]|uniref:CAAX prenyl protease n=1 Tax=Lecanosticta acicola TaxID=111012 RepID=A0AAI9E513_9PEZI|nr:CAAX prenyl protease 1 [Lecanosticta acicola]
MDFLRRLGAGLDSPTIPWKSLIITFSVGEWALNSYLLYRQYRVLQHTKPPAQLKNEVDQKTYDKSQAYGRAKAKFSFVTSIWAQIKNYILIQHNVYYKLWAFAGTLMLNYAPGRFQGEITQSLLYICIHGIAETILSTPIDYYHHFVLEAAFGFNKQTLSLFITDKLKGIGLLVALGTPIGAGFLKIVQSTGDSFFFWLWLFMLAVQLLVVTLYPSLIVPLFNKLTPLEPGPLKQRVEALAQKLKFPLGELQVIDGSKRSAHSNAYFTGLPFLPRKIVLYDTLIEKAETKEVEAVLAHELGHWKMGHTSKLLAISSFHLFYVFALFGVFINNNSLYEAFGFHNQRPIIIGFMLFNEVLTPTDAIVKLLMNVLTRKYEFQADAFSFDLGYAPEMAAALIKLQIQNLSAMDSDWAYSAYHYSHPTLTERLKAIGWTSEKKISDQKPKIGGEKEANGSAERKEL